MSIDAYVTQAAYDSIKAHDPKMAERVVVLVTPIENDVRAAFEEWAKRTHRRPGTHFDRSRSGVYKDNRIASKWSAYRAGAAAAPPPGWIKCDDKLPDDETPVLIFMNGMVRIAELRWDHPGYEDSYESYRYWDDPIDDGQDWHHADVAHWMPLPEEPK